MIAGPSALEAHEPVGRHANARQTVLARSVLASYSQPTPIEIPLRNPRFATVTGLALYGAHRAALVGVVSRRTSLSGGGVDTFAARVKTWLQDFF